MAELTEKFGGRTSGELIRADDWNGLIAAIEQQFEAQKTQLDEGLQALDQRLVTAEGQLNDFGPRLDALDAFAAALRARQRRIDLSAPRFAFALGERAEIVAHVTDLAGARLNLADAGARPWIDFVTVWGSLKPAPGFVSKSGSGGRTVTVQVNADGEARVLLRAAAGDDLGEEQELEVAAVLGTAIGTKTVAATILEAPTPASTNLEPAYAIVGAAYKRADTEVMRHYLDASYLAKSAKSFTPVMPTIALNWRDEHATVLAFVKPDDSPGTSDGAMAVASIRVTFRDWTGPWILTKFLPPEQALVDDYTRLFENEVRADAKTAELDIMTLLQNRTHKKGILGIQRELAAARKALGSSGALPEDVVLGVDSAVTLQQSLLLSQALTPLVEEDIAPARSFSKAAARSRARVDAVAETAGAATRDALAAVEGKILADVRAENTRFTNEVLNVRLQEVEQKAVTAVDRTNQFEDKLNSKAEVNFVARLLDARRPG